ncbi:MAG: flagellar basal body P-ring formation protein FlgA [Bryobacterales bacterium]|nr:flagellar basal body P-ring formation protein FlgA [Bryobacterales bacterium]
MLEREEIVQSIHRVLKVPADSIEVFDFSRYRVPVGTVEFPAAAMPVGSPLSGRFTWRGRVRYGKNRTAPVWAIVRVSATHRGVVSRSVLLPGVAIGEDDLEVKDLPGWRDGDADVSPVSFAGRTPKRRIEPGTELRPEWFVAPKDVRRGGRVEVQVQSGLVALRLEGVAEGEGSAGDYIWVSLRRDHWPARRLRVRVMGAKKVEVEATNEIDPDSVRLADRDGSRVRRESPGGAQR